MAERIGKEKINREEGWLYFLGMDGYAWRKPTNEKDNGIPERVGGERIEREAGWLYFVDRDGYVARAKMISKNPPDVLQESRNPKTVQGSQTVIYKCDRCGHTTKTEQEIKKHMKVHAPVIEAGVSVTYSVVAEKGNILKIERIPKQERAAAVLQTELKNSENIAASKIIDKYTVYDRALNLPNPIEKEKDVEAVLGALKIVNPQLCTQLENTLSLIKASVMNEARTDYSICEYRLELNTLSEEENTLLTDFLKKNLPKTAETYGSAVVRMVMGDKIRTPQDVDIQLHVKDGGLAEELAEKACDLLNKSSSFHDKFEVGFHNPGMCLLPARRKSVVMLKADKRPVLDIHIEGEEGSIPRYEFGYKRLAPVSIEGMKVSPIAETLLDKFSSSMTLRYLHDDKTLALVPFLG